MTKAIDPIVNHDRRVRFNHQSPQPQAIQSSIMAKVGDSIIKHNKSGCFNLES
jgi:hypothetical protein